MNDEKFMRQAIELSMSAVAELADAQVSDSCGYCFLVGSSPIVRTNIVSLC